MDRVGAETLADYEQDQEDLVFIKAALATEFQKLATITKAVDNAAEVSRAWSIARYRREIEYLRSKVAPTDVLDGSATIDFERIQGRSRSERAVSASDFTSSSF